MGFGESITKSQTLKISIKKGLKSITMLDPKELEKEE